MDSWNLYQIIFILVLALVCAFSTIETKPLYNRTQSKRTQKRKTTEHRTPTSKNIK